MEVETRAAVPVLAERIYSTRQLQARLDVPLPEQKVLGEHPQLSRTYSHPCYRGDR